MPTYAYTARDALGALRTETIESDTEHEAVRSLRADGLTVTDIRLGGSVIDRNEIRRRQAAKRVKRDDVISFTAQMSVMLETGVPIAESLDAFLKQAGSSALGSVVEVVADRINSGVSFSAAIAEFPRVFPTMMVSLIRASEETGALGEMLGRVSAYLGKDRKTMKQIRGALTYPLVMVTLAISVTGFLVTWVLPRFAKIYESRSAALPKPTQILLGTSTFIEAHAVLLIAGAIALIVGSVLFRASNRGRVFIDWVKVRAPVIGPIFRGFYLSRATRTLGTLLAAGVSLLNAVSISRGVTANHAWDLLWDEIIESMSSGGTIGEAFMHSDLLEPSFAQMIAAGERTGRLPGVLDRVATVCEEDLDERIKTATQLIEPAVIVFMGATIGGIAIALLLPIFSMGSIMTQ